MLIKRSLRYKRVFTWWFHVYEIIEQAKLIYIKQIRTVIVWRVERTKNSLGWERRKFLGWWKCSLASLWCELHRCAYHQVVQLILGISIYLKFTLTNNWMAGGEWAEVQTKRDGRMLIIFKLEWWIQGCSLYYSVYFINI